jgi:hypothetical protein
MRAKDFEEAYTAFLDHAMTLIYKAHYANGGQAMVRFDREALLSVLEPTPCAPPSPQKE